MNHPPPFAGRRALVTGGANGIGRATAARLTGCGADVVIADVDGVGALVGIETGARFTPLDVGDAAAWGRLVAEYGPFDLVCLNAGVTTLPGLPLEGIDAFLELDDADYRRIVGVNVDGVVFGMRAVLPGMLERGAGDIVVTASLAGLSPIPFDPVCGMTKHGVVGLVRGIAAALDDGSGEVGVCVSAVCPGFADTRAIGEQTHDALSALGVHFLSADDVADAVVRAVVERTPGAQWVVVPHAETHVYEWAPVAVPAIT